MTNEPTDVAAPDPIQIVAGFMVEGNSAADIIEYLRGQKMTTEEAALIFEQAISGLVRAATLPKAVRKGWCLEALRDLYRKLVASGDYAGALGAVKEIAKLSDIYKTGGETNLKAEIDEYIDTVLSLG